MQMWREITNNETMNLLILNLHMPFETFHHYLATLKRWFTSQAITGLFQYIFWMD